jgi:HSP20 family protein
MDYIKIRFADNLDQSGSKSGRFAEDIFRSVNPLFSLSEKILKPQIDVYETKTEIYVFAEIAGIEENDFDIEISGRAIKISGRRRHVHHTQKGTYKMAEIQYGPFERTLLLPSAIDKENATASYINGIIYVRLSKAQREKTFEIPISDG